MYAALGLLEMNGALAVLCEQVMFHEGSLCVAHMIGRFP